MVSVFSFVLAFVHVSASSGRTVSTVSSPPIFNTASLTYLDGSAVHGTRNRRMDNVQTHTPHSALEIDFTFKGTAYSFNAELAPSFFSDGAVIHHGSSSKSLASLHEPSTYKTRGDMPTTANAVITVSQSGKVSGLVLGTNGDQINIDSDPTTNTVRVSEMKADKTSKCGNADEGPTSHAHDDSHSHAHDAEEEPEGSEGPARSLWALAGALEPWFGSDECFTNDTVTRSVNMGLAMSKKMYDAAGGTDADAEFWLADILAKTNLVFESQLNIVLTAADLYFSEGSTSWDNTGCKRFSNTNLEPNLDSFISWTKPSNQALWHLFDDCFSGSTAVGGTGGLGSMGVLCRPNLGAGLTYNQDRMKVRSTWLMFAHEVGHNFGAAHSFEEGTGTTGGIMDYADGKYRGVFQFNTRYRKQQVCSHIRLQFDTVCSAEQVVQHVDVCGDGILNAGEECECANNAAACSSCTNCKLDAGKECTPDAFLPAMQECCGDDGMFSDYGSECALPSNLNGMCTKGVCIETNCAALLDPIFSHAGHDALSTGDYCKPAAGINFDNDRCIFSHAGHDKLLPCVVPPCHAWCVRNDGMCLPFDGWLISGKDMGRLPEGTACKDANNDWSTCNVAHGNIACGEQDKCWVRMPSGCDKYLSEPAWSDRFGYAWFEYARAHSEAQCTARAAAFNTHCGRDNALTYWSKYSDTPLVPTNNDTTPAPLLHSWEWEVVFASGDQYGAVNVGETDFNAMFNRNPMRIIKRLCAGCQGLAQKEMYYRRYTNTSDFSVYSSMLETWSETNNVLGVDFDIFSTLANAETRTNAWSFCSFDDPGVGFPRDCGPYGPSGYNWNSLTLGDGQDVEFSVPISPDLPPYSTTITTPTTDTTTTIMPAPLPNTCQDLPPGWKDNLTEGCTLYAESQFCTSDGGFGPGWDPEGDGDWGTFSDYQVNGVDANQACCVCGGGTQPATTATTTTATTMPAATTTTATTMPTPLPNTCQDWPPGWKDSYSGGCAEYAEDQFCTSDGEFGPGWDPDGDGDWGTFTDYQMDGVDANQACCVCGGGIQPATTAITATTATATNITTTSQTTATATSITATSITTTPQTTETATSITATSITTGTTTTEDNITTGNTATTEGTASTEDTATTEGNWPKCDAAAQMACSEANKERCSSGSAACGVCKSGFKASGGTCVTSKLTTQVIYADDFDKCCASASDRQEFQDEVSRQYATFGLTCIKVEPGSIVATIEGDSDKVSAFNSNPQYMDIEVDGTMFARKEDAKLNAISGSGNENESSGDSDTSIVIIIGVAVGGVAVIAIIIGVMYAARKASRTRTGTVDVDNHKVFGHTTVENDSNPAALELQSSL